MSMDHGRPRRERTNSAAKLGDEESRIGFIGRVLIKRLAA